MKFELSDFMELDTKALLAVNGGSDCGSGYSPPSNPSAGGGSRTPTGGGGSGSVSGGGGSGGGYCSGASDGKTIYANPYYKDGGKNSTSTSTGGGNCGSFKNPNPNKNEDSLVSQNNKPDYQIPDDPNDYHCDIIAYNTAIDNGEINAGTWDGNDFTVNEIYNNNYDGQGSDNSIKSNSSGYVFYDWDNNGTYDHMEYYTAGSGSDYTVYVTDGIGAPTPVLYDANTDGNGHASIGTATFVPIN